MTKSSATNTLMDHPVGHPVDPAPSDDVPKTRHCLRCRVAFQSEWSGQRICTHCKSSNAWRQGGPARNGMGRGKG